VKGVAQQGVLDTPVNLDRTRRITIGADDIAEKGPYTTRRLGRTVGMPYVPLKPTPSMPDIGLQMDMATNETSELIVTLAQLNQSRLQQLLKAQSKMHPSKIFVAPNRPVMTDSSWPKAPLSMKDGDRYSNG
jgi:hypothetical protein